MNYKKIIDNSYNACNEPPAFILTLAYVNTFTQSDTKLHISLLFSHFWTQYANEIIYLFFTLNSWNILSATHGIPISGLSMGFEYGCKIYKNSWVYVKIYKGYVQIQLSQSDNMVTVKFLLYSRNLTVN